eukprot:1186257-Prorocentrum_minimum.AAC.3
MLAILEGLGTYRFVGVAVGPWYRLFCYLEILLVCSSPSFDWPFACICCVLLVGCIGAEREPGTGGGRREDLRGGHPRRALCAQRLGLPQAGRQADDGPRELCLVARAGRASLTGRADIGRRRRHALTASD